MARSQIWDGAQWVSMTGGVGDGGGSNPDDDYLRLDAANNNAPPNNFLRQSDADIRYLRLTGDTMAGDLGMPAGTKLSIRSDGTTAILEFTAAAGGTTNRWSLSRDGVDGLFKFFSNAAGATVLQLSANSLQSDAFVALNFYAAAVQKVIRMRSGSGGVGWALVQETDGAYSLFDYNNASTAHRYIPGIGVNNIFQDTGSAVNRNIIIAASPATGGINGDVWMQY